MRLPKLFADGLYQRGHRVPLSYVFPTLRWIMDTPLETPVHDPVLQRIADHLAAAQVGLLTAADSQENSVTLLEAHEFVWQALTVLSRATQIQDRSVSAQPSSSTIPSHARRAKSSGL